MKYRIDFFFCYFVILVSSLFADKVGVFPYKVEIHNSTQNPYLETELPRQLQQVSIFLLKLLYESEFVEENFINISFPSFKEGLSEQIAKVQIHKICKENLFSYFVTGEIFYTKEFFNLRNSVFSCKTLQKLYWAETKSNLENLQKKLRENLKKIFPFLKENQFYKKWISKFSTQNEIFVLLDLSGSMEMMLPVLKNVLDIETMHIYGIQQNESLKNISNINEIKTSGRNSTKELVIALEEIKKELIPFKSELWIFFDSFEETSKEFKKLGMIFRELTNLGVQIKFFQTYKMGSLIWKEIENFKVYQNFYSIPIAYGRVCGFSNGFSKFFVRNGSNFYLCEEERELEYLKGIYEFEECRKLEVYNFTNEELDLDLLCSAYEKKNKLKLLYVSSVKTNLELQTRKSQKTEFSDKVLYKVLLKNEDSTFWIYLTDQKLLNQLLEYKEQNANFYIGLSFEKRNRVIQNITNKILLLEQKDIPKLFVIKYNELEKKSTFYPEDLWFLWVKVLDLRYE